MNWQRSISEGLRIEGMVFLVFYVFHTPFFVTVTFDEFIGLFRFGKSVTLLCLAYVLLSLYCCLRQDYC